MKKIMWTINIALLAIFFCEFSCFILTCFGINVLSHKYGNQWILWIMLIIISFVIILLFNIVMYFIYIRKNKKEKKKFFVLNLSCVIILILTIVTPQILSKYSTPRYKAIKGEIYEITNNSYSYEELIKETNSFTIIFPKELASEKAMYFCYIEKPYETSSYAFRAEVYLECTYTKDVFLSEIERLRAIKYEKFSRTKQIVYSNDLFTLPSFVACYSQNTDRYLYALIDYNNLNIKYIYLFRVGKVSNIVFNIDYAPSKQLENSDFDINLIENGGYCIFYV